MLMATGMQPGPSTPAPRKADDRREGGTEAVKDQARETMAQAKDEVRVKLGEQQQVAASSLGDIAGALRTTAGQMRERNAMAAQAAERAAEGLERLSGTLRSKDLDTMVRDVESFARRQPMLFLGAAVGAGFLAIRFLKSSSPSSGEARGASDKAQGASGRR
jgi:hypothetical protein